MSAKGSFYRKIVYLVLIAILLFPISQLGAPSTLEDEGGTLARIRDDPKYNLGQTNLGEIDPASETIRMATLGLRGVAVSILWNKAIEYKKKEDWTNFRATLTQLAKLQPYFISFWRFQAWNLSYNVSVELDDVQDRFYYVKRGIEFLNEGIKYNRDHPFLLSDLGWFLGNKIGKSDEKEHYRRLFKADDELHPEDRKPRDRDNWLVAKSKYDLAISAVDDKKKPLGEKNPVTFYEKPAKAQMSYSEAIEREGEFGEYVRNAWETAERLWGDYGDRDMLSTQGTLIRIGSLERLRAEEEQLIEQIEGLRPGSRDEMVADRRATLSEEQLAAYELKKEEIVDEKLFNLWIQADQMLTIKPDDLANYVALKSPEKAAEARKLANQIVESRSEQFLVRMGRQTSNYEYWMMRAQFEQTKDARDARRLAYRAKRAFREADLLEAKRLYEESFDAWSRVFEQFPKLPEEVAVGADLMEYIEEYARVLKQLELSLSDEEIDRRFPLWRIVELHDADLRFDEDLEEHEKRLQAE